MKLSFHFNNLGKDVDDALRLREGNMSPPETTERMY
jgi:hypothetical protein